VLAALFPGQGSQEVGMGRDVFEASDTARAVFEAADAALGFGLSKLCFEGPEDELVRTENQQPAILTVSIALLRALEEKVAFRPDFVAGHSLGEYSALVAAGALDFEDAVRTVRARGRFMQEAVPGGKGAMAAVIGCPPEDVEQVCSAVAVETGRVVAPANFNSSVQTVIAGEAAAVRLACERAADVGAKRTVELPVSAPFHCALMAPAAEKLAGELAGIAFRRATPPVITNVEAQPNADPARMPALLEEQVTAPVRFVEMIQSLSKQGVGRVIEIGPGRVLTGLVRRIDRNLDRANLSGVADLAGAVEFVTASV
jgi:[acyl-carrier-protein] S-malonyltransferase